MIFQGPLQFLTVCDSVIIMHDKALLFWKFACWWGSSERIPYFSVPAQAIIVLSIKLFVTQPRSFLTITFPILFSSHVERIERVAVWGCTLQFKPHCPKQLLHVLALCFSGNCWTFLCWWEVVNEFGFLPCFLQRFAFVLTHEVFFILFSLLLSCEETVWGNSWMRIWLLSEVNLLEGKNISVPNSKFTLPTQDKLEILLYIHFKPSLHSYKIPSEFSRYFIYNEKTLQFPWHRCHIS